jgi:hypothetical protein
MSYQTTWLIGYFNLHLMTTAEIVIYSLLINVLSRNFDGQIAAFRQIDIGLT